MEPQLLSLGKIVIAVLLHGETVAGDQGIDPSRLRRNMERVFSPRHIARCHLHAGTALPRLRDALHDRVAFPVPAAQFKSGIPDQIFRRKRSRQKKDSDSSRTRCRSHQKTSLITPNNFQNGVIF